MTSNNLGDQTLTYTRDCGLGCLLARTKKLDFSALGWFGAFFFAFL